MSTEPSTETATTTERRWQPIPSAQRRVLGVLIEKAKTTPEAYPMTINAIRVGSNQKNNRAPLTSFEEEDVQDALDGLRQKGAVAEVLGTSRVSKYRHYFYEWLGVDKVEAAVMAELLLRGPQTEGELRTRASRMEQIADLDTLRNVLRSLKSKELVISLNAEGRGHVITHGLYPEQELEKVRRQFAQGAPASGDDDSRAPAKSEPSRAGSTDEIAELRSEIAALRQEVAELRALIVTN